MSTDVNINDDNTDDNDDNNDKTPTNINTNKTDIINATSVIIVAIISWIIRSVKTVLIKKVGTDNPPAATTSSTIKVAAKNWAQVFKNLVGGINQSILNLANNAEAFASNGVLNFIPWLGNPNIIQRTSVARELVDRTKQIDSLMTPDVKEKIQQLISSIINLNVEILSDLSSPIETMISKALDILTEVGERAGRGIMSFIINVVMSAVGEIPVVGGIIDLIMSILRGINSGLQTGAPMAQAFTSGLVTSILTIKDVIKGIAEINNASNRANTGGGKKMKLRRNTRKIKKPTKIKKLKKLKKTKNPKKTRKTK